MVRVLIVTHPDGVKLTAAIGKATVEVDSEITVFSGRGSRYHCDPRLKIIEKGCAKIKLSMTP